MKTSRLLLAGVVMLAAASGAMGADAPVTIEVVGAKLSPTVPSGADWGWWNPSKYPDGFVVDDEASFEFTELRMLTDYGEYTLVLAGEWYPDLTAEGTYTADGAEAPTTERLSLGGSIYDLGFGMNFGRSERTNGLIWIGATYMDLGETRIVVPPDGSGESRDRADIGIWGAVAGVEGSVTIKGRFDIAGRVLFRWATGDRDATISSQNTGGGEVELSDSIDRTMWGADLGIRWHASDAWWFEAGYRYRDQTLDDGPVRFSGPQVKMAVTF